MRNNLNELISRVSVWRATRRSTPGEQPDKGVEVDEKNDQIALRGIVAGREILRNDERNNNSPETGRIARRPERKNVAAGAPIGLYCACPDGQNGNLG
jgi:hypothetical protein